MFQQCRIRNKQLIRALLGTLLAILLPTKVLSQDLTGPSTSSVKMSRDLSAAQTAPGRILVFVYRAGVPVPNFKLKLTMKNPQAAEIVVRESETNADGFAKLPAAVGQYDLSFQDFQQTRPIEMKSSEDIEVTLVLPEGEKSTGAPEMSLSESQSGLTTAPKLEQTLGSILRVAVTDEKSRRPVADAFIRIAGFEGSVKTNTQGRAEVRLPSGVQTLVVSSPAHQLIQKLIQMGPSDQDIQLELVPSSSELEEFVVLAPKNKGSVAALVEVRRSSQAVAEVLGAEQMSRQGDSDAASSLRRVTGLTLVGGKYVYVRGLGERYSAVQMNGFSLPSPEPARRVVPLDLFPTSVLESVVVQKSFSPELPAEFGGGLIQLKTRSLPDKFFARLQLSANFEESNDRLGYEGGRTDVLGVDDGTRRMPGGISQALGSGRKLFDFSGSELQQLGISLNNTYEVKNQREDILPGLTMGLGHRWKFQNITLGAAGSAMSSTSSESVERTTRKFNVGAGGVLASAEEAKTQIGEIERKLGATLDLGIEVGQNTQVLLSGLFVRNSTDEVQVKNFSQSGDSYDARRKTNLDWVQRDLSTRQIQAKHKWDRSTPDRPVELEWRLGTADAFRDAPDAREYVYVSRGGRYEFNTDTTGNRRVFSELYDNAREASVGLNLPQEWGPQLFRFKVGVNTQEKERRSDTYRLHFKNRYPSGQLPDLTQNPEQLFARKNICPDCFELTNLTESADSYTGRQSVNAVYVMSEWSPVPTLDFVVGARDEGSEQEVRTFFYYDPNVPTSRAGLRSRDLLPAYAMTWKPTEKLRVRLAYGETVARPDFRELSTVPFIDDETGYEAVGNSRLRGTVIRNLDHRWEYYFNPDEYASIGFFQKRFESPIEEVFEPGPNLRKTYENALAAENRGIELEARVGFRGLSRDFRRWSVLTNVSLIDSKIQLDESSSGVQTSNNRPLQGQSPYVVNIQLQYDRPAEKTIATLLYNRIGARITEVGTGGRPDIFEQPFDQLDFVLSTALMTNTAVQLRARNLLDPEQQATQGTEVVRSYRKGRSMSVGINATF